jgi:hypothetical protein
MGAHPAIVAASSRAVARLVGFRIVHLSGL